jgi:hypothetical protein
MDYIVEVIDLQPKVSASTSSGSIQTQVLPIRLTIDVTPGSSIGSITPTPAPVNLSYSDLGLINFVPLSLSKTITVIEPVTGLVTTMVFFNAPATLLQAKVNIEGPSPVNWKLTFGAAPRSEDFTIYTGSGTPVGLTTISTFAINSISANSFVTLSFTNVPAGTLEFSLTLMYA